MCRAVLYTLQHTVCWQLDSIMPHTLNLYIFYDSCLPRTVSEMNCGAFHRENLETEMGQRKKRMAYKEAVTGWWEVEWKRERVSAARPHHRAHYLCGRKLDLCEGEHNSTGGRKDGENTRLWRWMPPRVLVVNNNRSRRGSAQTCH